MAQGGPVWGLWGAWGHSVLACIHYNADIRSDFKRRWCCQLRRQPFCVKVHAGSFRLAYQHDGREGCNDGGGEWLGGSAGSAVADDDGVRGVEDYQHLEDGS